MIDLLKEVRKVAVIGFVGGSDFAKISEQLAINGQNSALVSCVLSAPLP